MTLDQGLLFGLFAVVLALLLWGRFRHDLVAAAGLLAAVVLGLVPEEQAFSGFSNHAVLIVALVLVASRAFENSGALGLLAEKVGRGDRSIFSHILVVSGLGAALSAVINNVAALAMLMPLDIQASRKAGRPPGLTLMPLAFATILGGMVTLIGTPSNIIASGERKKLLGEPFHMFDFTPVGICAAAAGLAFVALIGWRLVPRREDPSADEGEPASFKAELKVPEESAVVGKMGAELDGEAEQADVLVIGLIRDGRRLDSGVRYTALAPGDILVVEGSTDRLAAFMKAVGLSPRPAAAEEAQAAPPEPLSRADAPPAEQEQQEKAQKEKKDEARHARDPEIIEAVVRSDSRLTGRSAAGVDLRSRNRITLLGIARAGIFSREQVHTRIIHPGDLLLLTGSGAMSAATLDQLGLIAVNRASVSRFRPREAALAVGFFVAAIVAASTGLLPFAIAIAIAVVAYAAAGLVPAREFYQQIEWPVVVLLACLLPIGAAFQSLGGTSLIARGIGALTHEYPPVVALAALMIATMALSDVLNNIATIVITGPVAVELAQRLSVNPDTFLMGTTIACSCAFLTPLGHKNNTLIMGPGRFRFSDYWRMGLPLEAVVLAVSIPMLLVVWPL
ncbi:MAG: SLC13 family permease [Alphaproteobacteria bacterium]|nr:SLC13 family permease [Alphaproteobacteria bacterium]